MIRNSIHKSIFWDDLGHGFLNAKTHTKFIFVSGPKIHTPPNFAVFFRVTQGVEDCSVAPLDGAALLGIADLTKVDLILESGTAAGRSAELMGRFFKHSNRVQIVTVDWGDIGDGGRCGKRVEDAHQRLKNFSNVKALIGDSFKILGGDFFHSFLVFFFD